MPEVRVSAEETRHVISKKVLQDEGTMSIPKPFLNKFSVKELMHFIDHHAETGEVLHLSGHTWESCDQLAQFLGFGYNRAWSQEEVGILTCHYSLLGAEETAKLLPLRSAFDCICKAHQMGIRTTVKRLRQEKEACFWSSQELETLSKYHPLIGGKAAILLSGRSETDCLSRANKMGLTVGGALW